MLYLAEDYTIYIFTLSLHDALPISEGRLSVDRGYVRPEDDVPATDADIEQSADPSSTGGDRKSTRLNSSHLVISYAVFCLKNKKNNIYIMSNRIIFNDCTNCLRVKI